MRLLRARLTGEPHALCEVSPLLAEVPRKTINTSKRDAQSLKIHRGFIAPW
jgi:hypothetical protein